MSRCNFEIISCQVDIIFKIYRHLALDDQLRLSRASGQLKSIFETYIWKEKYLTLTILERTHEVVVCNANLGARLCLNYEMYQEFIKTYAANVRLLIIKNTMRLEEFGGIHLCTHGTMIENRWLNIRHFKNLESLRYYSMKVPMGHLKLVAELYPNLQELQLTSCSLGKYINVVIDDIVPQLKNLRDLCCVDALHYQIKFSQFYEIASKKSMECFKVNAMIEPEENAIDPDNPLYANRVNLKDLRLRTFFSPEKWSTNYPLFLHMFNSLVVLSIEIADNVTDKTLATLAESCNNLDVFSMQFTNFQNIQMFVVPPKVSCFSLYWCKGLTSTNLRQILSLCNIRKFYSDWSNFEGTIDTFQVSPLIESINIAGVTTEGFQAICENNEHLKELSWYHNCFDKVVISVKSLVTYKNLNDLYMHNCHLHSDSLIQLEALHSFTTMEAYPCLSWSYIIDLLKHPTLKEITIRDYSNSNFTTINVDIPQEEFTTNVVLLEVPLQLFEVAIGFWCDIFSRSKDLKRIRGTFCPPETYERFLRTAINHRNFPRFLNTIKFCGVTIRCNELRRNCDASIQKLHKHRETGGYQCLYGDGMPCVVFERSTSSQTTLGGCLY